MSNKLSDTDLKRQQDVLEHGVVSAAYHFARDIPGADIQALQRVVLKRGSGVYAYLFARNITGADIKALQQVVLDRGDAWDAYLFAKNIDGADISALHEKLRTLNEHGLNAKYRDKFNTDMAVQGKLKAQLSSSKTSKPKHV